jgi:hypothetical protein
MITEEEKEFVRKSAAANVQSAREQGQTKEQFLKDLDVNFSLLEAVHKIECDDPSCDMRERQQFARETAAAEFDKEFVLPPKITEEAPLTFEEKETTRKFLVPRIKNYIHEGLSEDQCLKELEEWSKDRIQEHKKKCAAKFCVADENIQYMKDLVHDEYSKRTTLSVEEILKLAKEKGI